MAVTALTGSRIRERRLLVGLSQGDLARAAGISSSYLNLIEHNRRRIGGKLLVTLARALRVDPSQLSEGAGSELMGRLRESAAAHPDIPAETTRIEELASRFPGWSALLGAQQQRCSELERRVEALADRLGHDPLLAASLHELLSRVAAIRSTSSILAESPDLEQVWRDRFQRNLQSDSARLAETSEALVRFLDSPGETTPVILTPQDELAQFLGARGFHLAELESGDPSVVEGLIAGAAELRSTEGKAVTRDHLLGYVAEAARMPLPVFLPRARETGFNPLEVARHFDAPLPMVMRRLASLPETDVRGRIGLVTCDGAGALIFAKPPRDFSLSRHAPACALWPIFAALRAPGTPMRALVRRAGGEGQGFVSYSVAEVDRPQGFDGPEVVRAHMLLVPAALADAPQGRVEPVGGTCRLCPREDCPARREPSILSDGFDSETRKRNISGQ